MGNIDELVQQNLIIAINDKVPLYRRLYKGLMWCYLG